MDIGDLLLRWLSEEATGQLSEVKQGLWWLGTKDCPEIGPGAPGRWLRDAVSLAYLDIDWTGRQWSAAPPVLTPLPRAQGLAVLTGSRTAALDRRLTQCVEDGLVELYRAPSDRPSQDIPLPASLLVRFNEVSELSQLAEDLCVEHAPCFAYQGAALLSDNVLTERTSVPEFGAPLEQYDFDQRRYVPVPRPQGQGLYRLKRRDGKRTCQVLLDDTWYEASHEHGVYAVLALQGNAADVLRWLPEEDCGRDRTGTLFVDWGYPLPDLQRRVAAMCSGLAPRINEGAENLAYDNVPEVVAIKIARSLGQTLGDQQ
ncbi:MULTISPECIES: hypothetical protein [unclassified Streptomyces]|uniref:hypothetical protein n=1 Tax=unclassified Streptomyces TaxID=2593676 RepID=UPI00278C4724|nr:MULTISPECIES: hypothetical protein [unclassified Streptomyces]